MSCRPREPIGFFLSFPNRYWELFYPKFVFLPTLHEWNYLFCTDTGTLGAWYFGPFGAQMGSFPNTVSHRWLLNCIGRFKPLFSHYDEQIKIIISPKGDRFGLCNNNAWQWFVGPDLARFWYCGWYLHQGDKVLNVTLRSTETLVVLCLIFFAQ